MLALRWAALHWIVSTAHATSIPTSRLDAGRLAKLEAASANLEEAVELERTRRLKKELLAGARRSGQPEERTGRAGLHSKVQVVPPSVGQPLDRAHESQ